MIRLLFNGSSSDKGISSFQAFSLAISGRVGTGNIAGVATAIAMGGARGYFLDVGNCIFRQCFSYCRSDSWPDVQRGKRW
ncbi:alanine:cation symporter family protein [Sphingobacterium zeae]|uniref:alanine:cation symporter family protein n=1 Tax=Sphingobacterium zeae TaxID=1776859 RepID=UPI0035221075